MSKSAPLKKKPRYTGKNDLPVKDREIYDLCAIFMDAVIQEYDRQRAARPEDFTGEDRAMLEFGRSLSAAWNSDQGTESHASHIVRFMTDYAVFILDVHAEQSIASLVPPSLMSDDNILILDVNGAKPLARLCRILQNTPRPE